jgi:hypothetical protein
MPRHCVKQVSSTVSANHTVAYLVRYPEIIENSRKRSSEIHARVRFGDLNEIQQNAHQDRIRLKVDGDSYESLVVW